MKTAIFVLLLASQIIGVEPVPKVLSEYRCAGTHREGTYQTTLLVEPHKDTFLLTWVHTGSQGVGFRSGNQLAVAFVTGSGAIITGLGPVLYQIGEGELTGEWAGGGKIYTESCKAGLPA